MNTPKVDGISLLNLPPKILDTIIDAAINDEDSYIYNDWDAFRRIGGILRCVCKGFDEIVRHNFKKTRAAWVECRITSADCEEHLEENRGAAKTLSSLQASNEMKFVYTRMTNNHAPIVYIDSSCTPPRALLLW